MSVSVLILTLNEEANIADCLASVAWCDDVVILDSFSSDATAAIAQQHGVRLLQRQFDDYASQRNYGLEKIDFRHPWVLMLDADERVPAALRAEIVEALDRVDSGTCLFVLRRKDYLFGRWLRHSSGYPTWFGRLVRIGQVRVDRPINERYLTAGKTARLQGHLEHYPFNKGFSGWIAKHDRYSSMEAALIVAGGRETLHLADLGARDDQRRRRALKALVYVLPARPLLVFLSLYVLRGGILEGRAGLTFSLLRAWYEFMIDCKCRELLLRQKGLPV